jgi:hypothetical protein
MASTRALDRGLVDIDQVNLAKERSQPDQIEIVAIPSSKNAEAPFCIGRSRRGYDRGETLTVSCKCRCVRQRAAVRRFLCFDFDRRARHAENLADVNRQVARQRQQTPGIFGFFRSKKKQNPLILAFLAPWRFASPKFG